MTRFAIDTDGGVFDQGKACGHIACILAFRKTSTINEKIAQWWVAFLGKAASAGESA